MELKYLLAYTRNLIEIGHCLYYFEVWSKRIL